MEKRLLTVDRLTEEQSIELFTKRILKLKKETAQNIIEIGSNLSLVKLMLPHGEFTKYLEEKVDFTRQTANKFMKIADAHERGNGKSTLQYEWGVEKLYLLTTIPDEKRDEIITEENIKDMTVKELKKKVKEIKNPNKERNESEKIIDVDYTEETKKIEIPTSKFEQAIELLKANGII